MKYFLPLLAIQLTICADTGFGQHRVPSGYQPFTPTVVGGLPPNSQGLEQPVYVADRTFAISSQNENDVGLESLTANELGFDENLAIPTLEQMTLFHGGIVIAAVGDERIIVGDLIPIDKLTSKLVESPQFEMILRKELVETVTRKSLAQRFISEKVTAKPPKERAQARAQIGTKTTEIFYEQWVPKQKVKMEIVSDLEFEEKLAGQGKTLASMAREFAETTWAQEYLRAGVPEKPIINLSELQDYYNDHIDSFRRPARVRFQMLSAEFSKYKTKLAAEQAIAEMGNEVLFGGAPFEAVAKRKSTDFRASEGGRFDWTTQGALKSKVIDETIFKNPIRGLSEIIVDEDGYHIVEVLEREPGYVQSFVDAQAEIRKTVTKQKVTKLRTEFIKKVRTETPVWTKWPQDIPGSKDIRELE